MEKGAAYTRVNTVSKKTNHYVNKENKQKKDIVRAHRIKILHNFVHNLWKINLLGKNGFSSKTEACLVPWKPADEMVYNGLKGEARVYMLSLIHI